MRRIAIGSIAIVLLASLQCEPQETKAGPLTRLRQTSILVEPLDANAKTLGLSKESLEAQTLVGLRRDIPKLAIRESAIPFLYLTVSAARGTTVCVVVRLSMHRPVTILGDAGVGEVTFALPMVWFSAELLTGSRISMLKQVKDSIDEQLTEFAADYYRQNPQ